MLVTNREGTLCVPNPSHLIRFSQTSVWRYQKSERNRIRNFFPIPIFSDTESDTFFDTKLFPIPIPILFSIPEFFETESDTFFDTKIFRNRYRYFFWYQNFSKPIPILFSIPKFFETDTDTFFDTKFFRNRYRYHQNNWKSFETEKFRNRNVTLCQSGLC